jgi:hypothetical protein
MKIGIVLMLFMGLWSPSLVAQTGNVVRIKAGDDPETTFSPHGFYRYPSFNNGIVYLKDGRKTQARLNYNMLLEEMQFIAPNGDTMAIADPLSVNFISMDSGIFYYSNGYLEVIHDHADLKLTRKLKLNVRGEKIGAYNQTNPSVSMETPDIIVLNNMKKDLTINQDLLIKKDYSYYWLDKYSTVLKATKANLLKLARPDKKKGIEDYVKKNKIDFSKEEELKALLQYASQ